jgi:DUF4097 and DUF4098 domain-containing protein YvlB
MRYTAIVPIVILSAAMTAPARAEQAAPAAPAVQARVAQTPRPAPAPKPPRPPRADRSRARFEELDRQTLKVAGVTELDLSNISGDIVVSAGGGRDATIEVIKRGYGDSPEEARRQLTYVEARLDTAPGGRADLRVHHTQGQRNYRSSVEFRVSAPPQTRVRAKSISGNISIAKISGELSAESVSGDVILDATGRVSVAKSISGDVAVSGVTGDEPLVLSTVSGSIRLHGIKSRALDVNSVSGDVIARDVTCERAAVQTISGDVEYAGALTRGGRYELRAHSGSIRLVPAGDAGFTVDANSFSGSIRTDVPIKSEAAADADRSHRGPRRTALRGTYGDGGARVELTTFSGNITIAR